MYFCKQVKVKLEKITVAVCSGSQNFTDMFENLSEIHGVKPSKYNLQLGKSLSCGLPHARKFHFMLDLFLFFPGTFVWLLLETGHQTRGALIKQYSYSILIV